MTPTRSAVDPRELSKNPDVALPCATCPALLVGVMGVVAVVYNFRQSAGHARPTQGRSHPMNADDLATALTTGGSGWLVLSIAAVLPILWAFTLVLHFARPYVVRFLQR